MTPRLVQPNPPTPPEGTPLSTTRGAGARSIPMPSVPTFLSPEQLAEMLAVPVETVYQWRRKRTGPPGFRVGRHVRYDLGAVLAWVEAQTRKAA